jgi:hypothetical protein
MSRRRTSYKIRCWRMAGTMAVVASPFLAAAAAWQILRWLATR